jgi:hypothetical protein
MRRFREIDAGGVEEASSEIVRIKNNFEIVLSEPVEGVFRILVSSR